MIRWRPPKRLQRRRRPCLRQHAADRKPNRSRTSGASSIPISAASPRSSPSSKRSPPATSRLSPDVRRDRARSIGTVRALPRNPRQHENASLLWQHERYEPKRRWLQHVRLAIGRESRQELEIVHDPTRRVRESEIRDEEADARHEREARRSSRTDQRSDQQCPDRETPPEGIHGEQRENALRERHRNCRRPVHFVHLSRPRVHWQQLRRKRPERRRRIDTETWLVERKICS